MKNKAFTLIELLAVLVVLGIIMIIAIPSLSKMMSKNEEKKYSYHLKITEQAAKTYLDKNISLVSKDVNCFNFDYNELIKQNLIKEEDVTCTGTVQAIRINKTNNFTYKYYLTCKKGEEIIHESEKVPTGCESNK